MDTLLALAETLLHPHAAIGYVVGIAAIRLAPIVLTRRRPGFTDRMTAALAGVVPSAACMFCIVNAVVLFGQAWAFDRWSQAAKVDFLTAAVAIAVSILPPIALAEARIFAASLRWEARPPSVILLPAPSSEGTAP